LLIVNRSSSNLVGYRHGWRQRNSLRAFTTNLPLERIEPLRDCTIAALEGLELRAQRRDLRVFDGECASLLLELIEQHRREQMISDRLRLAIRTINYELRIRLRDFLGEILAGSNTDPDVAGANRVVLEGSVTVGCIVAARSGTRQG
jgi:hypothetical protein